VGLRPSSSTSLKDHRNLSRLCNGRHRSGISTKRRLDHGFYQTASLRPIEITAPIDPKRRMWEPPGGALLYGAAIACGCLISLIVLHAVRVAAN
jgi:hypothetical protein